MDLTEWWESQHRKNNLRYLTGSDGPEVWGILHIKDRVRPGAVVLNIGVGTGRCTSDLKNAGCDVSVLDVSPTALARVSDFARTYRTPGALPVDMFDTVICHLVAQHTDDDRLGEMIKHAVRSLRPGGVIAMQYACGTLEQNTSVTVPEMLMAGGRCRSAAAMARIAQWNGGVVAHHSGLYSYPEFDWHRIMLVRGDEP